MITKTYTQTNNLKIYFTDEQAQFLKDERNETGNTKSSIVRRALTEYMLKRIEEKIKKREALKQYMVDVYGENILNKD